MTIFLWITGVTEATEMGNSNSSSKTQNSTRPKKKALKQKEITKIIQRLHDFEEILQKKISFIDSQIDKEMKNARKHGKKNKRAAIGALRRKRNFEKKVERLEGTLSTIEVQRDALESASTNAEILRVMQQANFALRGANFNVDLDAINRLMDDVAEQQEFSREVNDAVASPVGFNQEFDEDELMQELEDLVEEDSQNNRKYIKRQPPLPANRQPSSASAVSFNHLPDVPTNDFETFDRSTVARHKREEKRVLQDLEAWIAS